MSLTLRQVEIFLAVADARHFGRAAQALHISQPVVSQEVRRLERAIGGPLFDRSTRTVALTELGRALLDEARDVHAASVRFSARAALLASGQRERVRIAVTPSVVNELLPAILRRVDTTGIGAVVEEVVVNTGEVASALLDGRCDIGIGRFVDAPPGFSAEEIRSEPVLVALSVTHPLAGREFIDLAELGELPLLLWPRTQHPTYYDRLLSICTDRGLEPLLLVSSPLIVGGRSYLIADGRAFAFVVRATVAKASAGVVAVPLADPAVLPLSVVWPTRHPRPAVVDLLALVREVGAELDRAAALARRD